MVFEKVMLSIRLQKKDLKRIFHYTYKYKIIKCINSLLFYQSDDLKTAIAISFYSIETLLLLTSGLGHI